MNQKVLDMMASDDLTEDLKLIESVCGMDTVKKLMTDLSGINFYIPKITSLETLVMRYIKTNSGKSFKQMARELGVSDVYVKSVFKRQSRAG